MRANTKSCNSVEETLPFCPRRLNMLEDSCFYPKPHSAPADERCNTIESLLRRILLDDLPDPALDDIARIASAVCKMPIALISLFDGPRQRYKSHVGLDPSELPDDTGFCSIVLNSRQPLMVSDALANPRYATMPAVTCDPKLRAYAGVPLVTSGNSAIGTLCVADRVPRELTAEQSGMLETLGRQIVAQVELRSANHLIAVQQEENARLTVAAQHETAKLRQSEQERAYVLSSARCLLWYADIREQEGGGNLLWDARFVDPDAAQRFLPIGQLPGETYQKARYRARLLEDRAQCKSLSEISVRAGRSYSQEFRCRALDGTIRWQHEDIHIETIEAGKRWRAVGVCIDITDSKRAEQGLQESERLYRTIGEAVPDFVWACGPRGEALFVNQRWADYTGLTLEQAANVPANVLHHPEDYPRLVATWKRADAEPYSIEIRMRRHDGEYRWFLVRSVPLKDAKGAITQWIGTTTDIHERKVAEEALRQSEGNYRQFTNAMPQLAWITDAAGVPEFFNQGWYDYTGVTPEEMFAPNRPSLLHPDERESAQAWWMEAVCAGEPYDVEYRLRAAAGTYRWFLARGVPLKDETGRVIRWFGTCTDIETQKRITQRERFLADSSAALASSLDYETTLTTVAKLAVPHLADWCVVHIVEADSTVRRLAAAHADPNKVQFAEELQARYPFDPIAPWGAPNVLRTGKSEMYADITAEMLAAAAHDEEHLILLRQVGFRSAMTVPMTARGQTLGTISFAYAESGRRYELSDIAIAEDLAHSAALAMDNARSFRAAQQEIFRRKQTEAQLRSHQDEIESLNARLRESMDVTHHHVRNNLQIILALTQLPIEEGKDTVPITALGRIEHHTCSLAAMHDLLMEKARDDADMVSFSARTALDKLMPLLDSTSHGREIRYHSEDIKLHVREIGSLCILVNELITNAVRHGSGAILLTMAARNGAIRLEVSDEGQGFPAGFDWRATTGTGLCLIDIAGRHELRGTVTYENRSEGGGRVVVEFPVSDRN